MSYKNIALTIAKEINVKYPNINVYYTFYNDISEIFIIIDDKTVYDSQEYINLVYDISDRYIDNNVFFSYVTQDEQMPKNAINLTLENMKESLKNMEESLKDISFDIVTHTYKYEIFNLKYKLAKNSSITDKYLDEYNIEHQQIEDKQIVPNGMLKPFMGFGVLGEDSCQITAA